MISGYVRLGTQDLDFEISILDCPIEREYRCQGGFQSRNPNSDLWISILQFDWEIGKRIAKLFS